ncbi:MAG: RecT-like protein [Phage 68_12]|nr:MAG: RecT-like protein [Phage 68_12]
MSTSTEVELHRQQPLEQKVEWVKLMATASLLPAQYRDNPGNLFYAVEFADSLGVDRINAITSIHVIGGKPSASADLIAGLIRKAGHKLRIIGDDTYAEAQLIRADDPDFTFVARWDEAKARAAKLWGTGNWLKYPGSMLRARAITEVARMGASDALYGVVYTPEELGATVDAEGNPEVNRIQRSRTAPPFMEIPQTGAESDEGKPAAGEATAQATDSASPEQPEDEADASKGKSGGSDATPSRASEPPFNPEQLDENNQEYLADPEPDEDGAVPAEIVEDAEPRWTPEQRAKMMAGFTGLDVADRAERLQVTCDLIGRSIESANELTLKEASRVIDALEQCKTRDDLEAIIQATVAHREKGGE